MTAIPDITDCLDVLELDLLLAGSDDRGLRRRLTVCTDCQRRLANLEACRVAAMTPAHVAAQAGAILARLALAQAPRRSPARWAAPAAALAAALAVCATWLRPPDDTVAAASPEIRWKGGDRFDVLQVSPGPERVVADGDPVPPSATLSFRAACPRGCSVTLFIIGGAEDEAHHEVRVLRDRTPPPWQVAPGVFAQLPVSVDVDDTPGDDRIVALFCAEPIDTATLRAALARSAPSAISACEIHTHHVPQAGSEP